MDHLKKTRQLLIMKLFSEKKHHEYKNAALRFIQNYPDDAFGWKFSAIADFFLGEYQEAQKQILRAINLNKKDADSITVLGNILRHQGRIKEALECYERALEINKDQSAALNGKGLCLIDFKRSEESMEEAVKCFQRGLEINPNQAELYYNMGVAYAYLGRLDEAMNAHLQAIRLDPESHAAHNNLGLVLQDIGRLDEALTEFDQAIHLTHKKQVCYYSNKLFALNYHPDKSAEEIFSAYQEFDRLFGLPYHHQWRPHPNDPDPERRLRIGYISGDFRAHSTCYFLEPLLANHDHSQFEIFAYVNNVALDAQSWRYRELVDRWVPIAALDDAAAAERIRADRIDILIDLAGHTAGNRLGIFARRPAPVSTTWMGYGYTTGLSAIDYFLADPVFAPPGSEPLFAERLWYLDRPCFTYRPNPGMGEPGPLPALRQGFITLASLTRGIRINDRVIRVWSEILKRLPQARLVIDSKGMSSPGMQDHWAARFAVHGIARERLQIGCHSPPWDLLREIDLSLDCFPHNSGTTLCESLYLGVPFITLAGRPSVGRVGSAILTAAGHPEWIAHSEEDYIAKVLDLASDLDRLATIRANLRAELESSPLRDEPGFARAMERAYRTMWQQWCAGQTQSSNLH